MLLRGRGLLLGLVLLTSLLGGGGLLRAQEYGDTPLHAAARDDDLTRVRSLVEAGAAVDARRNTGSTPLMFAAANSTTPEIVQLLLDQGADPLSNDKEDKRAIDFAEGNASLADTPALWDLRARSRE